MLRVNMLSLFCVDGKHYYNDELFTGVAFGVVKCVVESEIEYRDGVEVCVYSNAYFSHVEGFEKRLKVDDECLDDDDDARLFYETPFSGVAYAFDGDRCVGEEVYIDAYLVGYEYFYRSGKPEEVSLTSGGVVEEYEWNEDGEVRRFEVAGRGFSIKLGYENKETINFLSIKGGYFDVAEKINTVVMPIMYKNPESILRKKAASHIFFSGSVLNDEMIGGMVDCGFFEDAVDVSFMSRVLTAGGVRKLLSLGGLRKLEIDSTVIARDEAVLFKKQRPECELWWNDQEVLL